MPDDDLPPEPSPESPLSLDRLREAFAAMLGEERVVSEKQGGEHGESNQSSAIPRASLSVPCEVNPRSVVEAILFVGRPDNGAFSSRELAAAMRGVSPSEIESAIGELNAVYSADEAPYHIEATNSGYRMVLRDQFARMRDKFYGRMREAKLSPAAMEVLAIIAYNQPVTADAIGELRGAANGAAISSLVRRRLVRIDRPAEGGPPRYSTTDRFLKLFGLASLEALPRSEELEKV